ncbi:MAG: hypothetical protein ACO1N2_01780 [Candidatus Saccharimonadota bacterium]
MTAKEERYFTSILEDINSKFDLIIELVQHINTTKANQADIIRLEEHISRLEQSASAMLTAHTSRIYNLEKSLRPS